MGDQGRMYPNGFQGDYSVLTLESQLELLRKAVAKYDTDGGSLPWKKMSKWMKSKGSSYEFAPATCAKKWQEIEVEV